MKASKLAKLSNQQVKCNNSHKHMVSELSLKQDKTMASQKSLFSSPDSVLSVGFLQRLGKTNDFLNSSIWL